MISSEKSRASKILSIILSIILFAMMLLMVILICVYMAFEPVKIMGTSMENSYFDGDTVVMQKLLNEPEKGEVAIIKRDEDNVIKRIVAIEGESVGFVDNGNGTASMYVRNQNGEFTLVNEPYIKNGTMSANDFTFLNIPLFSSIDKLKENGGFVLSKNQIFVLGDNRDVSLDSRSYGAVDKKDVLGVVVKRVQPNSFLQKIISFIYKNERKINNKELVSYD